MSDIVDFSDYDLIDELASRGYNMDPGNLNGFSDEDIIDEAEARGFVVLQETNLTCTEADKIVQWMRCNDPRWESAAREFLLNLTNKII